MPVMDGMEATKILKKKMETGELKPTQIIAVTAASCTNEEDRKNFLENGFDECGMFCLFNMIVQKPFSAAKLTQIINGLGNIQ